MDNHTYRSIFLLGSSLGTALKFKVIQKYEIVYIEAKFKNRFFEIQYGWI